MSVSTNHIQPQLPQGVEPGRIDPMQSSRSILPTRPKSLPVRSEKFIYKCPTPKNHSVAKMADPTEHRVTEIDFTALS